MCADGDDITNTSPRGGNLFLNYVSIYTLLHFVGFFGLKRIIIIIIKRLFGLEKRTFIVFPYERITRIKYLTPNLTWCTASVLSPIWVNSSLDYTVMPTGCSVHHWPLHNTTRPNRSRDATYPMREEQRRPTSHLSRFDGSSMPLKAFWSKADLRTKNLNLSPKF